MRLRCPNCNEPIPAASVNVEQTLAVCPNCDEVFNFADHIPTRKSSERKIKPPNRVKVIETEQGIKVSHDLLPATGMARVNTQVASFLLGVLGLLILTWTVAQAGVTGGRPAASYLILGLTLGLPLFVTGLFRLINRRYVELGERLLKVYYRPIPSMGKQFKREDVVEFMVQISPQILYYGGNAGRRYDIDVKLTDGSQQALLVAVPPEYAQFIVQELNRALEADQETDELPFNVFEDEDTESADIAPSVLKEQKRSFN